MTLTSYEVKEFEIMQRLKNLPINNALAISLSAATRLNPIFDRISQDLIPSNKNFLLDMSNQLWLELSSPSLTNKQLQDWFDTLDAMYDKFENSLLKFSYADYTLLATMQLLVFFQQKKCEDGVYVLRYPTDMIDQFVSAEFQGPLSSEITDYQIESFPPYQDELLRKKRDFEEIESIKEMTYDILERLKVRAFDEGEALAKLLCHEKKIKWCPYSKDNCPCPTVSLTHSRPCTCPLFDDVVVVQ